MRRRRASASRRERGPRMSAPSAPSPILHHVNLKTRRMDEVIEWYGAVLGMQVVHRAGDAAAWLTDDEDKLLRTGMHHFAFEYASVDDLLDTYVRLRDAGIRPHAALDHGMTTSLYYVDPDGNSVELQVDNFGSWADSSEWMRTSPQFAADPIGTPFDPELMVEARDAGAGLAELHARAYAGELRPDAPLDLRFPLA